MLRMRKSISMLERKRNSRSSNQIYAWSLLTMFNIIYYILTNHVHFCTLESALWQRLSAIKVELELELHGHFSS